MLYSIYFKVAAIIAGIIGTLILVNSLYFFDFLLGFAFLVIPLGMMVYASMGDNWVRRLIQETQFDPAYEQARNESVKNRFAATLRTVGMFVGIILLIGAGVMVAPSVYKSVVSDMASVAQVKAACAIPTSDDCRYFAWQERRKAHRQTAVQRVFGINEFNEPNPIQPKQVTPSSPASAATPTSTQTSSCPNLSATVLQIKKGEVVQVRRSCGASIRAIDGTEPHKAILFGVTPEDMVTPEKFVENTTNQTKLLSGEPVYIKALTNVEAPGYNK